MTKPLPELADLVRLSQEAIISWKLDGTITGWNPAAERILGYASAEIIQQGLSEIVPADSDQWRFVLERIRQGETIEDFETRLIKKDDRSADMSLTLSPIRDENLRVIGVLCLGLDNSNRNRLQIAERDQFFLASIISSADDAIISKDLNGLVTSWNRSAERIFGYTADEMIGQPVMKLLPPGHLDEELQIMERIRCGERIEYYESRRKRKDGRIVEVSLTISPIRDRIGRIVGASKIARDISDRRRWQTAEAAQSFLGALVDSADDAIVSKTLDGVVTSWNGAAETIFGYTCEEMVGKPIAILIPQDHLDEEPRILQRIRQGERIAHYETKRRRKDGSIIDVSLTVSPIRDSLGRIIGASKIARDITEKKLAMARERELLQQAEYARQQAEEVSLAKDEFLATISHELRTPITAILGWTRMLVIGQLNAERQQKAFEVIDRNARSQAQLIEDLLDVSRIISGKLRVDFKAVDIAAVITAAVEALRPAADAKGIRIDFLFSSGAGPILGDAERLQQVVWNLLSNAIKFSPRGGLVTIGLRRVESQVEFHVTDNGIGIRPDFLPHVFERFSQADSSITRSLGGLGMGLAIVRSLVELHGGVVAVSSPGEGQGAVFAVKLPISVAQNVPALPPIERVGVQTQLKQRDDLVGLKILIVDDDTDTGNMLRFVLNECGAIAETAQSAAAALEVFERWHPDLLISDIGMPDVDGYELIRRIRQECGSRIPAVALTAMVRVEDRLKALTAGFQMHVSKPVEPSELITVVSSLASLINQGPEV